MFRPIYLFVCPLHWVELRRASAAARADGAFADADSNDEDDEDDEDEDDGDEEEEEEVEIDEMLRKRDRVSQMVPKVKSAASSSSLAAAGGDDEVIDEAAVQAMIKQHLIAQVRFSVDSGHQSRAAYQNCECGNGQCIFTDTNESLIESRTIFSQNNSHSSV